MLCVGRVTYSVTVTLRNIHGFVGYQYYVTFVFCHVSFSCNSPVCYVTVVLCHGVSCSITFDFCNVHVMFASTTRYVCIKIRCVTVGVTVVLCNGLVKFSVTAPRPSPPPPSTPRSSRQDLIRSSGKFELLDRMLPKLKAGGHRILMFSQMTRVSVLLFYYLTRVSLLEWRLV